MEFMVSRPAFRCAGGFTGSGNGRFSLYFTLMFLSQAMVKNVS